MNNNEVECVYEGICHLGEGPLWNVKEGSLYWTDIFNKRIWKYSPESNSSTLFWEGVHQVGGFAFTEDKGMVLCSDQGVFLINPDDVGQVNAIPRKLCEVPLKPKETFNDITVDPCGRIFAGTLRRGHPDGSLFRLEQNKEPVRVLTDIACSNGMTFSMDEKYFFHADSLPKQIKRYKYNSKTGDLTDPVLFFQGEESDGYPDGLTLDTEDHLWVAFWGSSEVCRINPDGEIVQRINVPAKQPSSVMFGGHDLSQLYITSACQDAADLETGLDQNGIFLGGPVFCYQSLVNGREEWFARF